MYVFKIPGDDPRIIKADNPRDVIDGAVATLEQVLPYAAILLQTRQQLAAELARNGSAIIKWRDIEAEKTGYGRTVETGIIEPHKEYEADNAWPPVEVVPYGFSDC